MFNICPLVNKLNQVSVDLRCRSDGSDSPNTISGDPIYTLVDCNSEGAIWTYKYEIIIINRQHTDTIGVGEGILSTIS